MLPSANCCRPRFKTFIWRCTCHADLCSAAERGVSGPTWHRHFAVGLWQQHRNFGIHFLLLQLPTSHYKSTLLFHVDKSHSTICQLTT